jgi:hypothetical protein
MSAKLFVYHLGPIDNWTGWTPLETSASEVAA